MERRPLPSRATETSDTPFKKYQNYQRERMETMQGSLMLVATVIATMTFQMAINPPGGVWQTDSKPGDGCANNKTCKAGTSVLAFSDGSQKSNFEIFVLLCTISFSASQTVILLLICGFSLRNRVIMWVLILAMCISVLCTSAAYVISIRMVMNPDSAVTRFAQFYGVYWVGLVVLLCLVPPVRFVFWLMKKILKCCCCCCCSSN